MSSKKRNCNLVSETPERVTRSLSVKKSPSRVPKAPRRSARCNGSVTCSDFGRDREDRYPTAMFCHQCKMWDDRDITNKRLLRESQTFRCRANHVSLAEPQQIEIRWWDLKGIKGEPEPEEVVVTRSSRSPRSRPVSFQRKWRQVLMKQSNVTAERMTEKCVTLTEKLEAMTRKYNGSQISLKKYYNEAKFLWQQVKTLLAAM